MIQDEDVLAPTGYMPTDALEDADMVILNTCHIREKASEKVFSDLGRLRQIKARAADQQQADADCRCRMWLRLKVMRSPNAPCGYGGWPANLSPPA